MRNIVVFVFTAFVVAAFSCGVAAQEQQALSPEAVIKILEQGLLDDMAGIGAGDQGELMRKHIIVPADADMGRRERMLPYQMMFLVTTMFGEDRNTVVSTDPAQVTVKTAIQPIEYVLKLDDGVWKLDIDATWERLPEKMRTAIEAMMQNGQQKAQVTSCLSNLKQLALAALMYAQDWERFPDADQWMDQLMPYIGENDAILHCPAVERMQYGYAMNENVSGLALAELNNLSEVVLFFETNIDERNAHGGAGDIANPAHHRDDLNNFAFCDGHCGAIRLGTTPLFEIGGGGAAGVQQNDEPMPKEAGPVTQLTDETFSEEVLEQAGWVIVDFGAEQCAPCRRLKPVFGQLARLYEGRVKFASIDVIQNVSWSNKLGVGPLPTLIIYNNGQQVDRLEGFGGADELKAWMRHHIGDG